jgi:hypothetical protein
MARAFLVIVTDETAKWDADEVRDIILGGAGYPLEWEEKPELLQVIDMTTDEVAKLTGKAKV